VVFVNLFLKTNDKCLSWWYKCLVMLSSIQSPDGAPQYPISKLLFDLLPSNQKALVSEPSIAYGSFFSNRLRLIDLSSHGFSYSFFEKIGRYVPFSEANWAGFLGVSQKTLQRSKQDSAYIFKPLHAEKILEIAELSELGLEIFGGYSLFSDWMHSCPVALDKRSPLELVQTSFGRSLLIDELHRIDHGLFA
jgi:putative toxin-antitoxin system antitoxin component (TIGR02293 family)